MRRKAWDRILLNDCSYLKWADLFIPQFSFTHITVTGRLIQHIVSEGYVLGLHDYYATSYIIKVKFVFVVHIMNQACKEN
jgi:hypothetical protein